MATYVNDLRLKEIATGDEAGTWGTSTNTNLELIGEALGYGTQDCFASDADATTTVADGASDPARAMYFKVTSSATLTATRTLTIAPNTISRVMLIENATTGSQSITISQGSGSTVTIASGAVKMVYLDGAGAGGAVVEALADLELPTVTVADLTATTADINAGTIDGTVIGGSTAAAGTFTTLTASGEITANGGIALGDNDKATFGASDDLEIYHDGTDSIINEGTAGNLLVQGATIKLQTANGAKDYLVASPSAEVTLYHDNAAKLATTSTGIDVTGTVTADGLTVDGGNTIRLNASSTTDFFTIIQGGTQAVLTADSPDGAGNMLFKTAAAGVDKSRMEIAAGGDISFYEDTGTTAKFFWDASAESLGIGSDTNSNYALSISENNPTIQLRSAISTGSNTLLFSDVDSVFIGHVKYYHSNNSLAFATNGIAADDVTIDSSGNLLVGKTSTTLATTGAEIRSDGFIRSTVSDATCLQVNRITGTGTAIDLRYDGTSVGSIVVTASATAYNTSSDYRLKENVVSMDNASNRVLALKPCRFNFVADPEKTVDGFLAHEAQEVVPEAVTGSKDAMRTEEYEVSPAVYEDVIIPAVEEVLDEEGNVITEAQPERTEQRLVSEAVMSTREVPDYQGIDQSKLVPLLTKALQEALQRIEALEAKLA